MSLHYFVSYKSTTTRSSFKAKTCFLKHFTYLYIWCKLQDVTVTLDNNWDNKHAVSCCYFLKMCCYGSRPVSTVAFKTLTFHKVLSRHTWGVAGSLVIMSLLIFSWFWQWNNFENRLMFDEVKAYKNGANFIVPIFWATLYVLDKTSLCSLCFSALLS